MADIPGDLAELEAATGRKVKRLEREPRTPLDWADLDKKPVPTRSWRIEHWLANGPTLLAGRGGIGKTLLAQTLATALALGRPFLDSVAHPCTVLFWACEDDHDELWRRQVAICRYFNCRLSDLDGALYIDSRHGRDNTLFYAEYGAPRWTPLYTELTEQVKDYRADVSFIDNIGQTFGGKENDRHHVTTFMNGMAGIAGLKPHSTVLLAHPGKQEGSEFSGSTAWENSVRMRWYMGSKLPDQSEEVEDEDPDVRYIAKRKTNYTQKDYRKLVYRDGVFETQIDPGSFSERYNSGRRDESAEEVVLKALDRLVEIQVRTIDARTSPDYLPKKMREMKLTQDFSPKELADAVNRLRLSGRITTGPVGKFANRTPKLGLVRGPS